MKISKRIIGTLSLITVLILSITSCSVKKIDINTSTSTMATPSASVITEAPTPTLIPTPAPTATPVPPAPFSVRGTSFDTTNIHKSVNGIDTIDDGVMRDITSMNMAKEMGLGINLGNTMESLLANEDNKYSGSSDLGSGTQNYEKCWGAVVTTQRIIDGMYAGGFDTVRIPVYWGNMIAEDGSMTINDAIFNRVEEIINYCLNHKLYVVINIHHYDGYIIKNFSKDEALEIMNKLWTQIAERYKEYSDYLIFEGYNESLGEKRETDNYSDNEMYDYVNALNKVFVDAVRATGGNNAKRMLIVSGYWTNIDLTTNSRFIIPSDTVADRIMVSVHYPDNSMNWAKKIGGDEWLNYTKDQLELLKKAFSDKGYVVFLGECSSIYNSDNFASDATITKSSECIKTALKMYLDYGFVPVLWDVNENFYSRIRGVIKSADDAEAINELYEYIH